MPNPAPAADDRRAAGFVTWFGVGLIVVAAVLGARALEFLCDDAFITFRYVSNAHDGLGLVWNPPPFRPVEGYTGFLWALWLWFVWVVTGVAPPDAANPSSIACGVALLGVVAATVRRVRDRDGRALAPWAVWCTLLCVAGNRTFLTWMTGGLETALFNLAFVGWVVQAFRMSATGSVGAVALWSVAAAAAALTRPDGLLVVAATGAVLAVGWLRRERTLRRTLLGAAPLSAVVAHVAWRRGFYGEWLPNTYFAKVTSPWPEAGLRYLACFLLEHGAWLWPPLLLGWLVVEWRRCGRGVVGALWCRLPALAAVAVVVAHVGYYVVRVGGDPFEYRILSQLVPLGALAVTTATARLARGSFLPVAATLSVTVASGFGWLHFALHQPELTPFYRPIAARAPALLRPLARWHDRQQAWLQLQVLCGRRELHAMFLAQQQRELPERARRTVAVGDIPVAQFTGVGLAGWVLPDIAILDLLGLNDWVVARTPIHRRRDPPLPLPLLQALVVEGDADRDGRSTRDELHGLLLAGGLPEDYAAAVADELLLLFADADPAGDSLTAAEVARIVPFFTETMRLMAHERMAPPGYVEALAPNVRVRRRELEVAPRSEPLTPARLRAIETEWWQRAAAGR